MSFLEILAELLRENNSCWIAEENRDLFQTWHQAGWRNHLRLQVSIGRTEDSMPLWYINLPWFTELVFFSLSCLCLDFVHIFIFVVCYSKEEEENLNTSFSHPLAHNREIFFFSQDTKTVGLFRISSSCCYCLSLFLSLSFSFTPCDYFLLEIKQTAHTLSMKF